MPAAPPSLASNDALFLDFDGSLVEIALNPADVVVPDALLARLSQLDGNLDGALAIISGRPVSDLDRLLAPLELAAAGEHGAEIRHQRHGSIVQSVTLPATASAELSSLNQRLSGTVLEVKTASAALHYREAPEHEAAAISGIQKIVAEHSAYELMHGKMVAEFKPAGINKGLALSELLAMPPFAGRRPVFIGDDVTDEAGFHAVNAANGVSIRVGDMTATEANYCLADVTAVHHWLAS